MVTAGVIAEASLYHKLPALLLLRRSAPLAVMVGLGGVVLAVTTVPAEEAEQLFISVTTTL